MNRTRKLSSIEGNSQRLDGGAMFGNAPKALWTRWITPDDRNRIPLACRALLVEEIEDDSVDRRILFEAGIGVFFDPALRDRFGVMEEEHVLLASLAARGLTHEDIDVVVLSHLHFDHAGGLLSAFEEGEEPRLLFPNARFVVGEEAWERAQNPHFRDRASFVPSLNRQLAESGRLEVVEGDASAVLGDGYRFHRSHGHTPGLLLTEIETAEGPVVFCGDLIPGTPWVHLPITMGYDRYPELLIEEKEALLSDLLERGGRLFFTHDSEVALAGIARDERGRYRAVDGVGSLVGWLALLLLVPLVACAPVRSVDDDDAAGLVCPGGDCAVTVIDGAIECGPGVEPPPENGIDQRVEEDGTISVTHLNFATGCCPDFGITAELDPDLGHLVVDYGIANDFCDCICQLTAWFTLVDPPSGAWMLVLPGADPVPLGG